MTPFSLTFVRMDNLKEAFVVADGFALSMTVGDIVNRIIIDNRRIDCELDLLKLATGRRWRGTDPISVALEKGKITAAQHKRLTKEAKKALRLR